MKPTFLLFWLAACEPISGVDKAPTSDTGDSTPTDSADTADTGPSLVDAIAPILTLSASYGIGGLDTYLPGYTMTAAPEGVIYATIAEGVIYTCPFTSYGQIDADCSELWAATPYSVDKAQWSAPSVLSIADAAADDGIGIAYDGLDRLTSGTLADVAALSVSGGYDRGYTGVVLHLDADADGAEDDIVVTASIVGDDGCDPDDGWTHCGELAVYLDATAAPYGWADANLYLPACAAQGRISYGPVRTASDGEVLYAACPGYGYTGGSVEGWTLPLTERSADWVSSEATGQTDVSGWYLEPMPGGGVVADARRAYAVAVIGAEGRTTTRSLTAVLEGDVVGTAPSVLTTSTGRVLVAIGSQSRNTSAAFAPTAGLQIDDGSSVSWAGGDTDFAGQVTVCDLSEGWGVAPCSTVDLPDDGAASCIGSVQSLVDVDGVVYVASAGWTFGLGEGCGLTVWRVE